SGPDETTESSIREHFEGAEIVEAAGDDLSDAVKRAVDDGAEVVAVAGGDGTIRTAASVLAETGVALLPVPAGTRNHFARELGIDTLDAAGRAWSGTTV